MRRKKIPIQAIDRFGEPVIQFSDPHGLPLELIGTETTGPNDYWRNSSIAEPHAITGFHSATATLNSMQASKTLLVDVMGMRLVNQEKNRYRFNMYGSTPGSYYDIVEDPKAPAGRQGGGTVHHIAFRTENHTTQLEWRSTLNASGLTVTNVRDRKYFQSIYFNAPEGVLFEIATDTPGFSIDEPVDVLGETLKLPEQFERMRGDIERHLPFLRPKTHRHVFHAPKGEIDDGSTLVTLHGTGGNEHDLVSFALKASRSSAILSPRGNVLENGMWRFFNRLANNIFDEADVVKKSNELSDFIISAVQKYGRDPSRLTALGYSNGANIAAAVLLLRPDVFSKAVLLRPMLPLHNSEVPELRDKKILIVRGEYDIVIPSESTDKLESLLRSAGADVTTQTINTGHAVTDQDLAIISGWLTSLSDKVVGAGLTAA